MSAGAPLWLLAAAAALALLPAAALRYRWRRLQLLRLASARLWKGWLGGLPATGALRLSMWLLAAALAAAAGALPRWGEPVAAPTALTDVAIALDVSPSMAARDGGRSGEEGETLDRLAATTGVLRAAVRLAPASRWSLAVGSAEAVAVVPPTDDTEVLDTALASPTWGRSLPPGSNLALLLATAAAELAGAGGARVIVLASDGEELDGDALAVARSLRRQGVTIVTLRGGSAGGGPVPTAGGPTPGYVRDETGRVVLSRANAELLAAVAGRGDRSLDASDPEAPVRLAALIGRQASSGAVTARPARVAPLALAAAIVATASFLLWPWRLRAIAGLLAVLAVAPPSPAAAGGPPDGVSARRHWPGAALVSAYLGQRAFARGDWEAARREYARAVAARPGDPALEIAWASAAMLAGDAGGEAALEASCGGGARPFVACYNLGTARLVRGDAAAAAAALRRAVVLRPASRTAWRNLEIALQRAPANAPPAAGQAEPALDRLLAAAARAALAAPVLPPQPTGQTGSRPW